MSNEMAEFGVLYGQGTAFYIDISRSLKLFPHQAVFHDAFVFMKSNYNVGPGYIYALSENPSSQTMFLGHTTGFAYKFQTKVYKSSDYKKNNVLNYFKISFHRCQTSASTSKMLSPSPSEEKQI